MNALLPRIPSMGSDGRLLNTLAADNCREDDALSCAECGKPVCLCAMSDFQIAREKWRVKADRQSVWHSACRPNGGSK